MLHRIPTDQLGPRGDEMGRAVETCIHCGFCLPTCPTYELLGDEADSPRGRIMLMKEVLEGTLDPAVAAPHIDRCLGCVACQTHCPSGVPYGNLLSSYRSRESTRGTSPRSLANRVRRQLASWTLPYPRRFALAIRMGKLGRKLSFLTPTALRPMLELVPDELPPPIKPAIDSPAIGEPRGRVMLHIGCAAQVLRPDITAAAIRVLNLNGIAVHTPPAQRCCGALHWHIGDDSKAAKLALANVQAFGDGDEPIITTAAGCGSGMHEYPLILAGQSNAALVEKFSHRVVDISVYLHRVGITPPTPPAAGSTPLRIAYHDACHLAHAQRVRIPPRKLLQLIPGVELIDVVEADMCCGSAGTYNIDQPELAGQLGERKAKNLLATKCDMVALGNIGCQVQIEQHLAKLDSPVPVLHTIQILDRAYRGELWA